MTRVLLPLDSPPRPGDAEALPDSSSVCVSSSALVDPDPTRSTLTQSLSARSKPASRSPGLSTVPVSSASQTSSLGHRRKGLSRKVRRHHRTRPGGTGDGDRKSGKEDRMEEDGEQDEERMEAEANK